MEDELKQYKTYPDEFIGYLDTMKTRLKDTQYAADMLRSIPGFPSNTARVLSIIKTKLEEAELWAGKL